MQLFQLKRREFVTLLGDGVAWPFPVPALQATTNRIIGAFMDTTENNPDGEARFTAFRETLRELGSSSVGNTMLRNFLAFVQLDCLVVLFRRF